MKEDDEFTFARQHKVHLMNIDLIINMRATKHMTLYRPAFDTYEVSSIRNVRLDDDNMAEAIKMGSIIIGVEAKGKLTRIHIMKLLHVPKLRANLLLVSKFLSKGLKV